MRRALLSVLVLAVLAAGAAPVVSADVKFRVIVHPVVKGSQIPRASLGQIFLKQAARWGDGHRALPVDQSVRSPIRQAFCADVLQQEIDQVQGYWYRRMADGVMPPPVKATDEEVVSYVASTPGAIGYVSAGTSLPDSVREIAVIN